MVTLVAKLQKANYYLLFWYSIGCPKRCQVLKGTNIALVEVIFKFYQAIDSGGECEGAGGR